MRRGHQQGQGLPANRRQRNAYALPVITGNGKGQFILAALVQLTDQLMEHRCRQFTQTRQAHFAAPVIDHLRRALLPAEHLPHRIEQGNIAARSDFDFLQQGIEGLQRDIDASHCPAILGGIGKGHAHLTAAEKSVRVGDIEITTLLGTEKPGPAAWIKLVVGL